MSRFYTECNFVPCAVNSNSDGSRFDCFPSCFFLIISFGCLLLACVYMFVCLFVFLLFRFMLLLLLVLTLLLLLAVSAASQLVVVDLTDRGFSHLHARGQNTDGRRRMVMGWDEWSSAFPPPRAMALHRQTAALKQQLEDHPQGHSSGPRHLPPPSRGQGSSPAASSEPPQLSQLPDPPNSTDACCEFFLSSITGIFFTPG